MRTRIILLLVTGSVVPLLIIGWIDLSATTARMFEAQVALLHARGDQLAGEIDQFNAGYTSAARRLAGVPEIVAFLATSAARDPMALRERLLVHVAGDAAVRGIGVVDAGGAVVALSDPRASPSTIAARGYFRAAQTAGVVVSSVYLDPGSEAEPTLAYVAPVVAPARALGDSAAAESRRALGYVVFWVRARALSKLASTSNGRAGPGSFAVMFDELGIRIAHTSNDEIVLHPAGPLAPEVMNALVAESRFGARTRALLEDVRPFAEQFERARARALDPALFRGYAPVSGQYNYGVARRLETAPWTVFSMVPEVALTAPISAAKNQKLVFGCVVLLATALLGIGFARQIVVPLRVLNAAARRIAVGDDTARVSLVRRDELRELGDSFNAMAEEVAVARRRLETQVAERTAALQTANASLTAEVVRRSELQLSLQEREEDLATTLDSIGDAVISTDREGRVVRMNPIAEALTGWTRAQARGAPLADVFRIVNEDTRVTVESPVARVLRDGKIAGLANHTVLISRSGRETAIADSAAPIAGADGVLRGVVLVFRDVTIEHDAQLALVASERKYRDLYEHSPDMYLTADLTTQQIVDCNHTLCDRLGYAKEELIGQPVGMLYHDSFSASLRAAATSQLHADGELIDVERILRRKDGDGIEVSLNVRGLRDRDGRIVAARAIWRDISARKQADRDRQLLVRIGETLQSSTDEAEVLHAVCTELAEHLGVARCLFADIDRAADRVTIHRDVHGDLPSMAGAHTLTAFGRIIAEDEIRSGALIVDDAATDPRTTSHYASAYLPLGVRSFVSVPLLRNGEWVASLTVGKPTIHRWQDREVHLMRLVAERVWMWIEHLRVLTELRTRSVREAVERTEARSRILVEAIQDYAVFMLDPSGVIATWNVGAQRIKGYTADEIIGQRVDVFYPPEDVARGHPAEVLEHARLHGRYEEEGWRVRKDGSRLWANVVLTAVRDARGQLEGFAKVTKDDSERRRTDEELRSRQAQLTQHLKERDVLLQEIHHRVKNNLQVISSLIRMQVRKLDPGPSRVALEECQTRVLAIALIHETLYQSKDYAEVQFASYARNLAASVFHTLGISQHTTRLALAIEPIPLSIDRAITCGLLINELITNALKHAFPGDRTGTISVGLARIDDKLRLEVRDDGVGLPETWNAYELRSTGLQLVLALTEQLHGELAVSGRGGAVFQITFAAA